ncbi:MAG: EF-hand domain-containing protein [Magnetococcales bacterium]|nr:EF-hand domain-containing protein [Magnetococcales bacterium]
MSNSMSGMQAMQRMGKPPSADTMISKMDKNSDGVLGQDEVKGKLADDFTTVDTDSNGQLTATELESALESIRAKMGNGPSAMGPKGGKGGAGGPPPGGPGGPPPGGPRGPGGAGAPPSASDLISLLDSDGDGALGTDEVEDSPLAEQFNTIDTDGDGVISAEELEADIKAKQEEQANQTASSDMSSLTRRLTGGATQSMATRQYSILLQAFGDENNTTSSL